MLATIKINMELRVSLIRRVEDVKPGCLKAAQKILGTKALSKEMREYAITYSLRQIYTDCMTSESRHHNIAQDLNNLKIDLIN